MYASSSVNNLSQGDKFANIEAEIARLSNDINGATRSGVVDQSAVAMAAANMHAGMGITSPLLQQQMFSPQPNGLGMMMSPDPRSILSPAMPGQMPKTPAGMLSPAQAQIQAQALLSPEPTMAGLAGVLSPQMAYPTAAQQAVLSPNMVGHSIFTPTVSYGRPTSVSTSPNGQMMYLESPAAKSVYTPIEEPKKRFSAPKTPNWWRSSCSQFWCLAISILVSMWVFSWVLAGMYIFPLTNLCRHGLDNSQSECHFGSRHCPSIGRPHHGDAQLHLCRSIAVHVGSCY